MDRAKNFITTLMIAVSNCSLYSREHESFDELAKKTLNVLSDYMEDGLEIMIIDDDLVVNETPIRDGGLHKAGLIKRLKRKGITRVDFMKGVGLAGIRQFIIDLSESNKGLKACPHIKTGQVEIDIEGTAAGGNPGAFASGETVDAVKEVFSSASLSKKIKLMEMQEVVSRFITTFKREANILQFLSPVKSYSEYTYIHAMNVSVLAMFQAEAAGGSDDLLHDIGIAALMHDVGKLFISKEVLEKKGKLTDREYREMQDHPLLGARYLTKNDSIPRLAPIAAYEHHMQFDGSGYPELYFHRKPQHICSQIIAVSDFFDALRSRRPYRESWDMQKIFALMKKESGTAFNPVLVDNFINLMQRAVAN